MLYGPGSTLSMALCRKIKNQANNNIPYIYSCIMISDALRSLAHDQPKQWAWITPKCEHKWQTHTHTVELLVNFFICFDQPKRHIFKYNSLWYMGDSVRLLLRLFNMYVYAFANDSQRLYSTWFSRHFHFSLKKMKTFIDAHFSLRLIIALLQMILICGWLLFLFDDASC